MPLEDFIITVYCLVDDMVKKVTKDQKLRQRDFHPKLSDSEIVTMQIIAEFNGIYTELIG